ncbi:MAG TPA: cyclase family protein [Thermoleophilaceae bacterium]
MTAIVDLSPTVPHGFRGPPSTDVGVRLEARTKPGYWQSSQASMSVHTGCHVESELHVIEGGRTIDAVPLDRVIGSALVLDLTPVAPRALIEPEALDAALAATDDELRPGDVVLLRTDWASQALGTPGYFRLSPALSLEAAEWLVAHRPRCVGCDFFEEPVARDPGWEAPEFVVHRALLGAGIPLVEGLVGLEKLPPRCEFFAPFFKFGGIEAAPARAFAIVPEGGS